MDFLILIKNGCDNLTATAAPVSRFARPAYGAIACHNHDGVVRRAGSACLRAGWSRIQYGEVLEFLLAPHLRLLLCEVLRRLDSGDRVLTEEFISGRTSSLVDYIGNDSTQEVQTTIHNALAKVGTMSPSLTEPYTLLCTYTVQIILSILTALIAVIIAYGAIGQPLSACSVPSSFRGWYSTRPTFYFGDG